MTDREISSRVLLSMMIIIALAVPVSAAGLTASAGNPVITLHGATSPVLTIEDTPIDDGQSIAINIKDLLPVVQGGTITDWDVAIFATNNDPSSTGSWTYLVAPDPVTGDLTLTMTCTGGPAAVGETITITFTGAENPWTANSGGMVTIPLTAERSDGAGSVAFDFTIQTPTGLSATQGPKITETEGSSSTVITVIDESIAKDDTIEIDLSALNANTVAAGPLDNGNIQVSDTAADADWTVQVAGDTLSLTSTNNDTVPGETVTVTFTGANGNPWFAGTGGEWKYLLVPTRSDGKGAADFFFLLETPPAGLKAAGGTKISASGGASTVAINVTGAPIPTGGTVTIDISSLHSLVASGALTDANLEISDTAASADWTGSVSGDWLTLVSAGGPTGLKEAVNVTFTGGNGSAWVANSNGPQTITLTATRSDSGGQDTFAVVIETAPPAGSTVLPDFSAAPRSERAPVNIAFTDASTGNPTTWNWSFGDNTWFNTTDSLQRNPHHEYTNPGTYTVILIASNQYSSARTTKPGYIHALSHTVFTANTTITGLSIANCGGPQTISVNSAVLAASLMPNSSVLEIRPPADRGFGNITIYALNGAGFTQAGSQITGSPTGVRLVSGAIAPVPGFDLATGTEASFNWSTDLTSYPCNAVVTTTILDGSATTTDGLLNKMATGNSAAVEKTAYTAQVTRTNIPASAPITLHMSVNSSWNSAGPAGTFIWWIAEDSGQGQFLQTRYTGTDIGRDLDHHEAVSTHGSGMFGLSAITGNNNPFQLVAMAATNYVNSQSQVASASGSTSQSGTDAENSAAAGKSAAGQKGTSPAGLQAPPEPPDPGKTEKIYANPDGVITQATTLVSTDNHATVTIGTGVTARGADGKPISSVSIAAVPQADLPALPSGGQISYTGMAYDLNPDGATFSPAISITFAAPVSAIKEEFVVRTYDKAINSWIDLPTTYNPNDGTITAQMSHFCYVGLFSKTVKPVVTDTPPARAPAETPVSSVMPETGTAFGNFVHLVMWLVDSVVKNPILIVAAIVIVGIVIVNRQRRRRLPPTLF